MKDRGHLEAAKRRLLLPQIHGFVDAAAAVVVAAVVAGAVPGAYRSVLVDGSGGG